jgi:hypothetical protein
MSYETEQGWKNVNGERRDLYHKDRIWVNMFRQLASTLKYELKSRDDY